MRKVSIMMLSYNHSVFTKLALRYIMGDTSGIRYPVEKLVLVDNGSTDDTVPWFKEKFLQGPPSQWVKKFELIENGKNLGIAKAQNQGCLACDKDSDVVMISNDVFVGPNWLSPLVKCVEYHKEQNVKLGWVSPYLSPEHTFDSIANEQFRNKYFQQIYPFLIRCEDAELIEERLNEFYGGSMNEFAKEFVKRNVVESPAGKIFDEAPSMIFYWTREAINEVGLFDEQFSEFKGIGGWGSEDVDQYIRMNNAGFFRVTTMNSFAHHLIGGTTRKIYLDDQNFAYGDIETGGKFLRKWVPYPQAPINYPLDTCWPKRNYDKWLLRKNTNFGDLTKLDLGLTSEERKQIDEAELRAQGVLV